MKRDFFKIFISIIILTLFVNCTNKGGAKFRLEIDGASKKQVVLSFLDVNKLVTIDTLKTNKLGVVSKNVELPDNSPNFYYISYNGKNIATLLLSPGDNLEIKVDTLGENITVNGSKECELYLQIDKDFKKSQKEFDSLVTKLLEYQDLGDKVNQENISYELGRFYVREKREALKNIVSNPYSFTNVVLLYRQFSDNLPLFSALTDGVYFLKVADSLKTLYPNSLFVKALEKEANNLTKTMQMNERLKNLSEIPFPEISLPDIKANKQSLSSLFGRPFILLFWHSGDIAQKMFNAELKSIYEKYQGKKLEIYAVCVDTDKAYWASLISHLPWINVCDGLGENSAALVTYNITKLPSMFIFDKEGDVVDKDVYDLDKLDYIISKL